MAEATPLTLADFLLARIAEDEVVARSASPFGWSGPEAMGAVEGGGTVMVDPARVLAECEAKRQIIRLAQRLDEHGGDPLVGVFVNIAALPYADHPDYRPEWAS